MKFINQLRWTIRYHFTKLLSYRSTTAYLDRRCVDWTLSSSDWPPYAYSHARYVATACGFWEYGKAIGHTPGQAARRAVRQMDRQIRKHALKELHQDITDLVGTLNDLSPK